MSLYESSVKKPIMTSLIFIGVVILGLYSLNKLPIDLLPKIETNTIMVMTTYSGASASDIETNITRPLENILNTVTNLKNITSTSKENRSIITLEFNYGQDINDLTNDVRDKLEMIKSNLPEGASNPIIFKFSTDMIPVVMISATAKESLPALYKILDDDVANPLARIDGVGSVSITGAPQREIQVYINPIKLEAYHLTIESIAQNIRLENVNTPAGSMDIGSNTYSLRVQGEFKDASELNKIVVGASGGKTVFLSDVAVVRIIWKNGCRKVIQMVCRVQQSWFKNNREPTQCKLRMPIQFSFTRNTKKSSFGCKIAFDYGFFAEHQKYHCWFGRNCFICVYFCNDRRIVFPGALAGNCNYYTYHPYFAHFGLHLSFINGRNA